MSYDEMSKIAMERAASSGFSPGMRVRYAGKEGTFRDINPFFYDHEDMPVYVDMVVRGGRISRNLVAMSKLSVTKEAPCNGTGN